MESRWADSEFLQFKIKFRVDNWRRLPLILVSIQRQILTTQVAWYIPTCAFALIHRFLSSWWYNCQWFIFHRYRIYTIESNKFQCSRTGYTEFEYRGFPVYMQTNTFDPTSNHENCIATSLVNPYTKLIFVAHTTRAPPLNGLPTFSSNPHWE